MAVNIVQIGEPRLELTHGRRFHELMKVSEEL